MTEAAWTPIDGDADDWNRPAGVQVVTETDQERITNLLLGHVVTKVDDEHLLTDDGTLIKAIGHEGGCSCGAGDYDLSVLNGSEGIITRVEYDYAPSGDDDYFDSDADAPARSGHPDDPEDKWTGYYRVFVYCEDKRINLMQFDGTDGNGYYGTGFELLVREATA